MSKFILMEPLLNQTFQELFSNGVKYHVPKFQRDYAWDLEQWEDLWIDIENLENDDGHYMGYLVLQRLEKGEFEIIDGQQRLITMNLILVAGMKKFQDLIDNGIEVEDNKKRVETFFETLIGQLDTVSLKVKGKLFLNRNNQNHFKDICSEMGAPNLRGLSKTNKLLNKGFTFFYKKDMGSNGQEIARFIKILINNMIFTKIVVQDTLNAYKIFETLNARGVQLSTPDLLKNYIFSVIAKNDDVRDEKLDDLDLEWSKIITQLGQQNFTDFLRYHYMFQNKLTTKKALFKSIRILCSTQEKAYNYLKSLVKYATIYSTLQNPYDEWWKNQNEEYNEVPFYLEAMKLFGLKQHFMILMIAFTELSAKEFIKTLKYLYMIAIRYNVICHNSPSEQDKVYNQIAMKIYTGEYKRASAIKNSIEFKKLYPSDDVTKSSFEYLSFSSRTVAKKIRFLLTEIENNAGQNLDHTAMKLEHICPYNPNEDWINYFGTGIYDISNRLGNMVLLKQDDLQQTKFNKKKKVYLKTDFILANKVAEYEEWDIASVSRYQIWLAEQAVKTWRVDYE